MLARWAAAAIVIAILARWFFEIPLGLSLVAVLVILPLVGFLVTIDDDLPGGWSNPDGKNPPPWRSAAFWGELMLRASISLAGFAVDSGLTMQGGVLAFCFVAGSAAGWAMMRTWPNAQ